MRPGLKILYTTGYARGAGDGDGHGARQDAAALPGQADSQADTLIKPVALATLAAAVRAALDAG